MILVTGAGGKSGRALIKSLTAKGMSSRGLVRSDEQGALLTALGASETVTADIRSRTGLARAMDGVRAVYHICPNMHSEEIEIGDRVIRAAQLSGVEHLVYHSVLHPQVEAMPHHWKKMRVEENLFKSGLPFTILQPAPYMQNLEAGWRAIRRQGVLEIPYALTTRLNLVDLEDLAEAAAIVLSGKEQFFGTYEICGPANLTQREVADTISACLGRSIDVRVVPLDTWSCKARMQGLDDYAAATLEKMFKYYEQNNLEGSARQLEWILQRPATSFGSYVRRIASLQSGGGESAA